MHSIFYNKVIQAQNQATIGMISQEKKNNNSTNVQVPDGYVIDIVNTDEDALTITLKKSQSTESSYNDVQVVTNNDIHTQYFLIRNNLAS